MVVWRTVTLTSPLSKGQCVERLRAKVDTRLVRIGAPACDAGVRGAVSDGGAVLFRAIWYRNSFQTRVSVALAPKARGCDLQCRIGPAVGAVIVMAVWFTALIFAGGAMIVAALSAPLSDARDLPASAAALAPVFMLVLMCGFAVGLFSFGRWLARGEEKFLRDFLSATLEARSLPGGARLVT